MRFATSLILFTALACTRPSAPPAALRIDPPERAPKNPLQFAADSADFAGWAVLNSNLTAGGYFEKIDSLVDLIRNSGIDVDEYTLVLSNPRILDSLRAFDYYNLMDNGRFVYDPNSLVVLRAGDSIGIPDSLQIKKIRKMLAATRIDVNIPAFRLRLMTRGDTLIDAPVRVGQNAHAFMAVINRTKDMKTPLGSGEIVRIARDPWYVNPRTGKRYKGTTRDDGRFTLMPKIPWLEPVIAGQRSGALIHPTTNRNTLGRAYSNGCVGTREDDAWTIYYHAPLGTPVHFRYELVEVIGGDTIHYDDVYGRMKKKR